MCIRDRCRAVAYSDCCFFLAPCRNIYSYLLTLLTVPACDRQTDTTAELIAASIQRRAAKNSSLACTTRLLLMHEVLFVQSKPDYAFRVRARARVRFILIIVVVQCKIWLLLQY